MSNYPITMYEWDFPPGGNFRCRIIETEPGIVIGQQRDSDSEPWRDEPCPMGWKNELISLAQEVSDWRGDAAMAAMENCGDEIRGDEHHCTCVGPLRKLARDLGNDKVALTLTLNLETKLRKDTESARKLQARSLQLQIGSLQNQLNEMRAHRDRWFAAAGQRQDELNEAHLALAWVAGSLPFESETLPAHLAPPEFVRRQVQRAKMYASTVPAQRPGESWRCPECGPGAKIDEDGCCAQCGADCDLDVPLARRDEP